MDKGGKPKVKKPKPTERALVAEPLGSASPLRDLCVTCDLFREAEGPFVPKGWTKRYLLVMDWPDDELRRLLRGLWREAGLDDLDVAITYANRCSPPSDKPPAMRQVRSCRPFLLRVVNGLRPTNIVGIGDGALKALTNDGSKTITSGRGRFLVVPGLAVDYSPRVWATFAPTGTPENEVNVTKDLALLSRPVLAWPERRLP